MIGVGDDIDGYGNADADLRLGRAGIGDHLRVGAVERLDNDCLFRRNDDEVRLVADKRFAAVTLNIERKTCGNLNAAFAGLRLLAIAGLASDRAAIGVVAACGTG